MTAGATAKKLTGCLAFWGHGPIPQWWPTGPDDFVVVQAIEQERAGLKEEGDALRQTLQGHEAEAKALTSQLEVWRPIHQ